MSQVSPRARRLARARTRGRTWPHSPPFDVSRTRSPSISSPAPTPRPSAPVLPASPPSSRETNEALCRARPHHPAPAPPPVEALAQPSESPSRYPGPARPAREPHTLRSGPDPSRGSQPAVRYRRGGSRGRTDLSSETAYSVFRPPAPSAGMPKKRRQAAHLAPRRTDS